ncbi:class II aldolase/adducin domain protein [Nemania abortiva]|nr:class II aldolase/adducin domain protein [Nemania abortiva]
MSTTTTLTETVQVTPQLQAAAESELPSFDDLARGDRDGKVKLEGIPTFTDPLKQREWMKQHMAAAFRFFAKHGYDLGIAGHISMRDPILEDHFWLNPYVKHFGSMTASDLVLVDHNGYVVEGGNQAVINTAGFYIHSEIHKARPDVIAAAHAHSMYGKTWSVFGRPLEMLTQDACTFFGKQAIYHAHGGAALAQEEGQRIANAIGKDNVVCFLRNHGLITTGRTVDEAAFLFHALEQACQSQILAETLAAAGIPKTIIDNETAAYTAAPIQTADSLYVEFQPEFQRIVEDSNGKVLG